MILACERKLCLSLWCLHFVSGAALSMMPCCVRINLYERCSVTRRQWRCWILLMQKLCGGHKIMNRSMKLSKIQHYVQSGRSKRLRRKNLNVGATSIEENNAGTAIQQCLSAKLLLIFVLGGGNPLVSRMSAVLNIFGQLCVFVYIVGVMSYLVIALVSFLEGVKKW